MSTGAKISSDCADKRSDFPKSKMEILSERDGRTVYSAEPLKLDSIPYIRSFDVTHDSVVATAIITYEPGTKVVVINWGDGNLDTLNIANSKYLPGLHLALTVPTDAPPLAENTILVQHIYAEPPYLCEQLRERGLSASADDYESADDALSNYNSSTVYVISTGYIDQDNILRGGPAQPVEITPRYRYTFYNVSLGFSASGYEHPGDSHAEFDITHFSGHENIILKENYWDIVIQQNSISNQLLWDSSEYAVIVSLEGSAFSYEISADSLSPITVIVAAKERDSKGTNILGTILDWASTAWDYVRYGIPAWWIYKTLDFFYITVTSGFDGSVMLDPRCNDFRHRFSQHPAWDRAPLTSGIKPGFVKVVATVESGDGPVDAIIRYDIALIADVYKPLPQVSEL